MSETLYELVERPQLTEPVLVMVLDGWIDAGVGAAQALSALLEGLDTRLVATFDTDALLDYRARRPVIDLEEGLVQRLAWPSIELRTATDLAGHDLLILGGAEPDHLWKAFCDQVAELVTAMGCRLVLGLGAYPAPAAHTRPVRLSCTASTPSVLDTFPFQRYSVEVPGGAQAAVEAACAAAGVDAAGIWAQVPHYVAAMPYPAASLALLNGAMAVGGLTLPTGDLATEADVTNRRINELIDANPQHRAMVEALEQQTQDAPGGPVNLQNLPSGDELAAELERFLRDQGSG